MMIKNDECVPEILSLKKRDSRLVTSFQYPFSWFLTYSNAGMGLKIATWLLDISFLVTGYLFSTYIIVH